MGSGHNWQAQYSGAQIAAQQAELYGRAATRSYIMGDVESGKKYGQIADSLKARLSAAGIIAKDPMLELLDLAKGEGMKVSPKGMAK